MNNIAFIDTEIDPKNGKILDIGCIKGDSSIFYKNSILELVTLVERRLFLFGVWLQPTSQLKARLLPCIFQENYFSFATRRSW